MMILLIEPSLWSPSSEQGFPTECPSPCNHLQASNPELGISSPATCLYLEDGHKNNICDANTECKHQLRLQLSFVPSTQIGSYNSGFRGSLA